MPRPPQNGATPHTPEPPKPSPDEGGTGRLPERLERLVPYPFSQISIPVSEASFIETMGPILEQCAGMALVCRLALSTPDARGQIDAVCDALLALESSLSTAVEIFDAWQEGR
jgi:hypothetical protein